MRKALAKPFPREKIQQKRGQGGRMMSYISHGLITERLNEADPDWVSEVIEVFTYTDAQGVLHCAGVTLSLTVGGITRQEAGGPQRPTIFADEIKNALSDALKRAAMRFGVALEMWEELIDAEYDEDVTLAEQEPVQRHAQPQRQQQARTEAHPSLPPNPQLKNAGGGARVTTKQLGYLRGLAKDAGVPEPEQKGHVAGQVWARFRKADPADMNVSEASDLIDRYKSEDFIDVPADFPGGTQRTDPVQAAVQGFNELSEEPAWMREPAGMDQWSR